MSVRNRSSSKTETIPSKNKKTNHPIYNNHFGLQKKLARTPGIPRAANWGWSYLHFSGKVMMIGVFTGLVSLTTPYWAFFKVDISNTVTFGLWHVCSDKKCSSIHDNLVADQSVPIWYHLAQGMMCIGVACSIVGLAIIANCIEGNIVRMTPTVHLVSSSVLAISALEQFIALYVFSTYIEEATFLFHRIRSLHYALEFHGSFFMGIGSLVCSIVGALSIFLDEELLRPRKRKKINEKERLMRKYYGLNDDDITEEKYEEFKKYIYSNGAYNPYNGEEIYPGDEYELINEYYANEEFNDFNKYNTIVN